MAWVAAGNCGQRKPWPPDRRRFDAGRKLDELSTTTIGGCRGGELENEYTANFWILKSAAPDALQCVVRETQQR